MAIMLIPDQVPKFWEAIKYSVVNAEVIVEEKREKYLNKLLYMLLSGRAQCFVRLGEGRQLEMIGLTSVQTDPVNDETVLFAYSLYSFKKVGLDVWKKDVEDLKNWAKANECKCIVAWSNNEKAISLFAGLGWKKKFESFTLDI